MAENIEKRIRRQVLGKTRQFLLSTLPGLERLCRNELSSLGICAADTAPIKGGIEFRGRVHECYLANLKLRTANRILMRISSFQATNFRQLGQKAAAIPWELYLPGSSDYDVRVVSRRSRLFHTTAVADVFREHLNKREQPSGAQPENRARSLQRIYVRAYQDRVTVSVDSSGELLHKRGLKTQVGKAPLRETVAAAILALAGYRGEERLVDPMCGAGTFSLEGAMMAHNIPAGWFRNFAFMNWPCFKPARWNYIRSEAQKQIVSKAGPLIFASDTDATHCQALEKVIAEAGLTGTVSVSQKDFFDLMPSDLGNAVKSGPEGLIAINPPYGRRLGSPKAGERLFMEICGKLKKDFKGWKIALIASNRSLVEKVPFNVRVLHFLHGGLDVFLLTGRV